MDISPEEVLSFIRSADKARESWLTAARRSWNEIKKRSKNQRIFSIAPNSVKRNAKYPAWYSIFKIRQPLLLSRIGIPIGKDTTQDGRDNIGATAAICLERLAVNLAKSFDFFSVIADARDDFLVTNFGLVRGYYERDEVKEKVKEYLVPVEGEDGEAIFVDANGKEVKQDDIFQDDEGFFIERDETIDVENERIILSSILYSDIYVDPDIRRWSRCKRIAFAEYYSRQEFKEIFGAQALLSVPAPSEEEPTEKKQIIKVFEFWDYYTRKVYYIADGGSEFLKPVACLVPDEEEREDPEDVNGIYDLEKFFPVPDPLIMNAPTDEFWPVPEFYQVQEIIVDIHTIFSRLIALTKAIRARLLFDNNVQGLKEALNEATEGDAFGVPNLTQALTAAGGSLENVVQYIPVKSLITAINEAYTALEQRLNTLYKLTGTSDLLQGLITDPTQRTFGERQMTEKYALNQIADPQRKMSDFVRDCYQLMTEMALKNFKDSSLDMYIMPQTLSEDHQSRYRAAIGMLKNNTKRFRIELETDSTIALNEEFDKQMRIELVNTLTAALEKTANIAQTAPALVEVELHCLKYLIQSHRQGKMFQGEITEAIDNVIKQAQEVKDPPFNKDQAAANLKAQEIQTKATLEQIKLQNQKELAFAKMQADMQVQNVRSQLDSFKLQAQQAKDAQSFQHNQDKLLADITLAREKLALDRDSLLVEIRKVADKKEYEQFKIMLEKNVADADAALEQAALELESQRFSLDLQERFMTEARLKEAHELNIATTMMEAQKQEAAPITMNIQQPSPVPQASVIKDGLGNALMIEPGADTKIERDALGNITQVKQKPGRKKR